MSDESRVSGVRFCVIPHCLRQDNTSGSGGTYHVILNLFQDLKHPPTLTLPLKGVREKLVVGRHYYADRRINSRVSKPDLHSSVQRVSCHPEVPEARQHTGHLWNFLCHPEAIAEGSQKMQPRPRISNTRKLVLKFNPAVVGVSPLSEAHRKHTPHFNHSTHAKRAAFTLAEVLITLAIIGIVAAMTIPTLSQKISDMQNKAIWKKKFSEISQVYAAVKLDNYSLCVNNSGDYNVPAKCRYPGDGLYVVRTTMSPEFVNAMVKHFKVIDTCGFPQYGESRYCNNYLDKWYGLCGGATPYSFYGSLISGTFKNLPTASTYCNNAQLNGLYSGWDLSKKSNLIARRFRNIFWRAWCTYDFGRCKRFSKRTECSRAGYVCHYAE